MIHRINIFLLSLFVALAPNFIFLQAANATTVGAEGWSVTKRLVQGATTFYDGTKNVVLNGKNYAAKGAAAITPSAAQASKMIVRVGAVLAVDLAIKSLIGAVDYVMDPANNRVKYYVDPAGNSPKPTDQYMWRFESATIGVATFAYPSVPTSICQSVLSLWSGKHPWYYNRASVSSSSEFQIVCYLSSSTTSYDGNSGVVRVNNPAYDPNAQPNREEKYLPYDAVASQIISDAIAEKAEGKAFVSSVADTALEDEERQIVPAMQITQQLNNSQSIPTSNTSTGEATKDQTDPNTGETTKDVTDLKLEFPEFCGWAPTVCQAAQAAIEFPKTFLEKFTKWDDWINRETKAYTYDETKLDTEDKRNFDFSIFNTNRFSVDDKCPTPEPQTITVLGVTTSFSLSLQPVCSVLELAKPALVACSYIYAAYIVIGAAKGG
ncbi:virulence factor TspB C-terminal domain-related protein [Acinetobacter lactucae]|uniref:virulence factor TspB C-terminal domain-related protein n=1 Tax=Acinetobacter lactucae TaxID=1785128 RepID=UPI0003DF90FB|nr:virulence factor TspB C-terminal domain-related protein [Acinetobacter lactucae]ETR94801.1 hypothetical protein M211_1827 [Acinetobacter lactucae]